jgi:hypothetical protein
VAIEVEETTIPFLSIDNTGNIPEWAFNATQKRISSANPMMIHTSNRLPNTEEGGCDRNDRIIARSNGSRDGGGLRLGIRDEQLPLPVWLLSEGLELTYYLRLETLRGLIEASVFLMSNHPRRQTNLCADKQQINVALLEREGSLGERTSTKMFPRNVNVIVATLLSIFGRPIKLRERYLLYLYFLRLNHRWRTPLSKLDL